MSPTSHLLGTRRPLPAGAHKVRDLDPNTQVEVTLELKASQLPTNACEGIEPGRPKLPVAYLNECGCG